VAATQRLLPTPAWVECSSPSVYLSLCLEHNYSKTNDPKVFKHGIENDLGIH